MLLVLTSTCITYDFIKQVKNQEDKEALKKIDGNEFKLSDVTTFEWTTGYFFTPYADKKGIEQTMRIKSEYIKDLSNIFLDLWSTDMIEAKEVKRIILNKFKYLKVQKEYPNSVNIRILILQSNNNWLIHILQNVRLKYLKYKYGESLK